MAKNILGSGRKIKKMEQEKYIFKMEATIKEFSKVIKYMGWVFTVGKESKHTMANGSIIE